MSETLFEYAARNPIFHGSDIDMNRDAKRLTGQLLDIYALMKDGNWRTLNEISKITGHPPASISAQLRNFRRVEFGSFDLQKNYLGNGLYQYRIIQN